MPTDLTRLRARRHAALGDPVRLHIVDELVTSDRTPTELGRRIGIESNLLAHHLDVLESVGMIMRSTSSGDGRRRYVHLERDSLRDLVPGRTFGKEAALFVCTRNSARSPLAAALWRSITGASAASAGTHPAATVHPMVAAAAERAGLDIGTATPRAIHDVRRVPRLVVTVCDQAHEEIQPADDWLHWSITDPVAVGTPAAFDETIVALRDRIHALVDDNGQARGTARGGR